MVTFQEVFSIIFPDNTKFIEGQYNYHFQEHDATITFEIPANTLNTFLDNIDENYESASISSSDDSDGSAMYYKSKHRQYTGMYLYPEKDGFIKVQLTYYRPGTKISKIFTR